MLLGLVLVGISEEDPVAKESSSVSKEGAGVLLVFTRGDREVGGPVRDFAVAPFEG